MFSLLKKDEMVVKMDDFGFLVREFVGVCLRPHCTIDSQWIDAKLRGWWPKLEEYYQRHIMADIEVAILLDEPPRYNRDAMDPITKSRWIQFIKDLRPPKHAFTIDYHCHKCKMKNVKLWRGVHGCADKNGNELLCATCLSPDDKVDEDGKWQEPPYKAKDASGNPIPGMRTDQVKGWLPAIPVDNTYWGYSSVPSQDVEWWVALPTYPSK